MVKSVEETVKRYARNSLRAYLEGEKTLNWVVGIVRESGVRRQELADIFDFLKTHSETARYQEVYSKCKELGWL